MQKFFFFFFSSFFLAALCHYVWKELSHRDREKIYFQYQTRKRPYHWTKTPRHLSIYSTSNIIINFRIPSRPAVTLIHSWRRGQPLHLFTIQPSGSYRTLVFSYPQYRGVSTVLLFHSDNNKLYTSVLIFKQ